MRKRKNKRTRGLTQARAAKILGVSRGHLNYVLRGHRASEKLARRYAALLAQQN